MRWNTVLMAIAAVGFVFLIPSCTQTGEQEDQKDQAESDLSVPSRSEEEGLDARAMDAALDYIQSLFQGDCDQSLQWMSDSLIDLANFEVMSRDDIRLGLCSSLARAIQEPGHSYEDFLRMYDRNLASAKDLRELYPDALPLLIMDADRFFDGHHLKTDQKGSSFIWPAAFTFMLRQEGGIWKVKGLGLPSQVDSISGD